MIRILNSLPVRAKALKIHLSINILTFKKLINRKKKSIKRKKDVNVKFKIMHSEMIMITIIMLIEPSPSQTKN